MTDKSLLGLGGHNRFRNTGNDIVAFDAPPVRESEIASPSRMIAIGDSMDYLFERTGKDPRWSDITSTPWRFFGDHKGWKWKGPRKMTCVSLF